MMIPTRHRLRKSVTTDIDFGGQRLTATVGFDSDGTPAEVFLSGAEDGSGMAAILADVGVVISIALQCGIAASTHGKSIARLPETIDGPAIGQASPIGAALDLLTGYQR
jgi:ribonucleoside-diphosphate reductase alpha chain